MDGISFIGLKRLSVDSAELAKRLAEEYYPIIKRMLKNELNLVLHVKEHSKGGARPKFSLHVRAVAPTRIFESSKVGYDIGPALKDAFEDIETEIHHTFHDNQTRKVMPRARN